MRRLTSPSSLPSRSDDTFRRFGYVATTEMLRIPRCIWLCSPSKLLSRSCNSRYTLEPMIIVQLPYHLRSLVGIEGDVLLDVPPPVTIRAILDAMEARYPVLRGTIRFHDSDKRRPWIRFFACEQDVSHEPTDTVLPQAIADGKEPFMVIGAIAGG